MAKKKTDDDAKKKSNKPKIIGAVVIALVGYKFFLAPKPTPAKADAPPKEQPAPKSRSYTTSTPRFRLLRATSILTPTDFRANRKLQMWWPQW